MPDPGRTLPTKWQRLVAGSLIGERDGDIAYLERRLERVQLREQAIELELSMAIKERDEARKEAGINESLAHFRKLMLIAKNRELDALRAEIARFKTRRRGAGGKFIKGEAA